MASSHGPGRMPGGGLVPDVGAEDPEHPAVDRARGVEHLQARLTRLVDDCLATGLIAAMRAENRWPDVHRVEEISHESCNHEWLWSVDPNKGPVMSQEEYINAVRLRLGAGGLSEPVVCGNCGQATLDTSASHALCCARGPSTRGHNRVRDKTFELVSECDPSAETEPLGLIHSQPMLRPADILTSAAGSGRLAALDVGIVAPEARGAGGNCVAAMHATKLARYAPYQEELERANVKYEPMVWSAYGRPHANTLRIIQQLAKRAARRRGLQSASQIQRRACAKITVEIWRRAAIMVAVCLPQGTDEEAAEAEEPPLGLAEPPEVVAP
jgi:hypothetical protein